MKPATTPNKGIGRSDRGAAGPLLTVPCSLTPVPSQRQFPVPSEAGFTLIELLISVTVLSLLATTVLLGWRIASSAWQKANSHLLRSRAVEESHQLLQEQMASMVPYQVTTAEGSLEFFFQGERQTARFLSRYSLSGRTNSGLYRIEYQIAEGTGGTKQLLLNEFPMRSREELGGLLVKDELDPDPAGKVLKFLPVQRGPQTVELFEGLTECHFEYYQPPVPPEPGSWKERWTEPKNELPSGMAIRIVARGETGDLKSVSIVAAIRDTTLPRASSAR